MVPEPLRAYPTRTLVTYLCTENPGEKPNFFDTQIQPEPEKQYLNLTQTRLLLPNYFTSDVH